MSVNCIEIKVPDIGDFSDVRVIEVLVKVGDTIRVEQSLITVESDKASMEIPSSHAGVVKEMKVKLDDRVSEGSVVLMLEAAGVAPSPPTPLPQGEGSKTKAETLPPPPLPVGEGRGEGFDLLVLGGGPGGYSAAFRAADLGLKVVLVERYATLGGVCLNVGCIPSKALLHVAAAMDEMRHLGASGLVTGSLNVNVDKLREYKEGVIGKLTGGLAAMAKMRKVTIVRGVGQFVDANHMDVNGANGLQTLNFQRAIIAAGSQSVRLPFMPQDPRVVDSTGALALQHGVPKKMLIIGGGIIGLEMGTVYSSFGTRLDVVEMQDGLMQGADRDLVKVWQKMNAHRFDNILLNTKTIAASTSAAGVTVQFEGADGKKSEGTYDLVLEAVGRTPNGKKIGAEKAGVAVTERGFINVNSQMRTNVPHIFAIGDIVGQPMLAHKAVHEGHVAAEVIAGELKGDAKLASAEFSARVIPSVAYTDPEVAWVGLTEEQAKAQGIKVKKGLFPWTASGRAIANGRDEGFTKLLFDAETHRIVGGGIVGTHAGDMIGEVALAIEMGADAVDIGKTIHPHPTLGESIGMAAEVAHGSCTDLPPQRK